MPEQSLTCRALSVLVVMLALSGCAAQSMRCEPQTVQPELTSPLPPLPMPQGQTCNDHLNHKIDLIAVCALWGARYQSLVDALEVQADD